jgi:outer membrane protein insertion porin family
MTRALASFGAAFVIFAFCVPATAQKTDAPPSQTVIQIRVLGNQRLSRNAVLTYVKTRVGSPYDQKLVKEDRDRMTNSGRFSSVIATREYTRKGVIVTFKVVERPTVSRVAVEGCKNFAEDKLLSELPFSTGDPLNKATIEAGKRALINQYHSEGYHFVKVTVDAAAAATNNEVIYHIVEGPRTIIKKVVFEGNHYYKNVSLKLKIETRAKFWPFISGAINTEKIERDVTMIRNLYVAEGFLDCEVGRELAFSDDKTNVRVTFLIKEGPRYRINNVVFKGNRVFSDEELGRRLKLTQGVFFTSEALRLDTKTLENVYGEVGYIEAIVTSRKQFVSPSAPTPTWAQSIDAGRPALINLIFNIDEHDQYRIGVIRIHGNSVTQERVIRRECKFYPEQLCNTVAIDQSKSRLKQLRLFDKVTITPIGTDKKSVRDIVVEVHEGHTAEFLIGVGVSSNSGLLGTISFTQRNFDILAWPKSFKHMLKPQTFKGAGQRFTISAEPGTEMMRFNINWFSPYLFDLPYSVGAKTYLFTRRYDHWDEQRLGVQASLGHRFKNRWYGELATRLENVQVDSDRNKAAIEIQEDDGSHTLMGFRGTLIRDRTDNRWKPTRGDRFNFSYEQVVGSETFGIFNASYRIYRTVYTDTLDRKHILAGRVSYGQMVGDAPVYEKFYGGGIGSIRGFKYRGISPRGHYPNGAENDDAIGGDMMFFAGAEYNFPLIADKLRGVVFLDTGTVEENFALSSYRASVGFGIRWEIPFFGPVPMAMDFAFPLAKDADDETQIFSFSLGWTF